MTKIAFYISSVVPLLSINLSAQTIRKAAIIGLSTFKTDVTHVGSNPVISDNSNCFVPNGKLYTDSMGTGRLKLLIDSFLPLMNFRLISPDSILNSEAYKAVSEKIKSSMQHAANSTSELPAKGYGYLSTNGLGGVNYLNEYFQIPHKPDIVIDAYLEFDVNHEVNAVLKTSKVNMYCSVFIKAYNPKGKKVFKFNITYKDKTPVPVPVPVTPISNCWGNVVKDDIGKYQLLALEGVLKKLKEELPDEIEAVKKRYAKED
ncbi:MAG: hypothetical protein QM534_08270 [Sediminibacterium sp.]|nr:hypothetical protein [Sediminibacterium sp.]